ncbi:hypothetical protein Dsin_018812 [Dipteronia sinensis]|uniref:DUF4283 domain-containing protein n=1 Tax=Dipteronia sinensis TaxID=43782 RepID=A0AAE0A7I8_9ROSI|nr:hypothetical protein Dsin_018812 [Dipteronia sinensis]
MTLKDAEGPVLRLNEDLKMEGIQWLSLSIAGKVLTTKMAFDDAWIVLAEPTRKGEVEKMAFNRAEFWVQIHHVPLLCMSKEIGQFLGGMVGEVIEVDEEVSSDEGSKFLRVRVVVEIDNPLRCCMCMDVMNSRCGSCYLVLGFVRLHRVGLLGNRNRQVSQCTDTSWGRRDSNVMQRNVGADGHGRPENVPARVKNGNDVSVKDVIHSKELMQTRNDCEIMRINEEEILEGGNKSNVHGNKLNVLMDGISVMKEICNNDRGSVVGQDIHLDHLDAVGQVGKDRPSVSSVTSEVTQSFSDLVNINGIGEKITQWKCNAPAGAENGGLKLKKIREAVGCLVEFDGGNGALSTPLQRDEVDGGTISSATSTLETMVGSAKVAVGYSLGGHPENKLEIMGGVDGDSTMVFKIVSEHGVLVENQRARVLIEWVPGYRGKILATKVKSRVAPKW